jgi:hypothetical protein
VVIPQVGSGATFADTPYSASSWELLHARYPWPRNDLLKLTRLAGENAVVLGQPSSHTMKAQSPSRRAA